MRVTRRRQQPSKYTDSNLLPALRIFVDARRKALESGLTDNGGAIHSIERIVDILCQRIKYPHLRHIQQLRTWPNAELSKNAAAARARGAPLRIEHVKPLRAFTQEIIRRVERGHKDSSLVNYIRRHYRLVLLTPEEATRLDRNNRIRMTPDRIKDAGIALSE